MAVLPLKDSWGKRSHLPALPIGTLQDAALVPPGHTDLTPDFCPISRSVPEMAVSLVHTLPQDGSHPGSAFPPFFKYMSVKHPHRLMGLNTLSPDNGTIWGTCRAFGLVGGREVTKRYILGFIGCPVYLP